MILLKVAAASALCRASSPAAALLLNNCSTFFRMFYSAIRKLYIFTRSAVQAFP